MRPEAFKEEAGKVFKDDCVLISLSLFLFFFAFKEYGGELKSLDDFHEEQKERLEKEYREWLIDSSSIKQLPKEKKTDKKTMLDANANACDPPIASLNKLSLD